MRIAKLCLSITAIALVVHAMLGVAEDRADVAPPQGKITIGKDTTYITKPLRSDGYPDYVAALNEIYSRGVTPENNAAVLLQQAFGPGEIKENLRPKFYELLGIKPLPEIGNYIVDDGEMVKRSRAQDVRRLGMK